MSIQDIGSIGELIAAIATIATLAYLALQIKQNTLELRQGAFRDVFQAYSNLRRSIYTDKEFSELLEKIFSAQEVSKPEKYRYQQYLAELLYCGLQYYRLIKAGQISDRSWVGTKTFILASMDNPLGSLLWKTLKDTLDIDFVEEIDRLLAGVKNDS